jgi:hypothetical protein
MTFITPKGPLGESEPISYLGRLAYTATATQIPLRLCSSTQQGMRVRSRRILVITLPVL